MYGYCGISWWFKVVVFSTVLHGLFLDHLAIGTRTARNMAVCATSCDAISRPCRCYQDGYVDCKAKNLTRIPSPMPECTRRISISRNGITQLEFQDFQGMTYLHTMEITNESITEIQAGVFSDLTALGKLTLTNNNIRRIAECAFEGLASLHMLYLSQNNITTLEARTFQGLFSLHSLFLDNNHISVIEPILFHGLSNLKYLHLQHNDLTNIPSRALEGLTNLTSINIYKNRFSKLNIDWFEDVNDLVLLVGQNPWNCTCALKEDYSYILSSFDTNVHCPVQGVKGAFFNHMCIICSYPAQFAGQTLRDISQSNFADCEVNVERNPTYQAFATPAFVQHPPTEDTNLAPGPYCRAKIQRLKAETLQQSTSTTTKSEEFTRTPTTVAVTNKEKATVEITTTAKNEKSSASNSMPAWIIALIIIVIVLIIATSAVAAILIVRKSGRKLVKEDTPNDTELQPNTFSNKSYDAVLNGK